MTALTRVQGWGQEVATFARDARRPRDFARVMQSRLSLSKIGSIVAPSPVVAEVDLRSFGSGVHLRSHTSDISVLHELLADAYAHLPQIGATTVVDLGANTGLALRWLHHRYPEARFVSVEPEPGNLEVLRANAAACGADVTIVAACVGAWERKVSLTTDTGEFGFRMLDEDQGTVPVLTMAHVLERAGFDGQLDVVKCDIEGAEAELFEDCRSWIGRVGWLVVECHAPYSASDLEAHLKSSGGNFRRVHLEVNPPYGTETITLSRA
jgi:FkbM family methyltransferase